MAERVTDTVQGDGYAVGSLDGLGEGPGFRKIRKPLGFEAFGVNALVVPEGFTAPKHYHDEQEELYFVHQGELTIEFGDGQKFTLGAGGVARVDAQTVRQIGNSGSGDLVLLAVGGKGGYVGRDGRNPEDE